jgi:energy-coupling factor transporter transmembrane protein EcfT
MAKSKRVVKNMPEDQHWAIWFGRQIVSSLLLGGGRVMQAISFSWTIRIVYGYLGVLLLEVLLERRFRTRWWFRPIGVAAVLALGAAFVFGFVYAPDPLIIKAKNLSGEEVPGTKIAEIEWRSEYSDLRVLFENNTDIDYHNLDFIVSTDQFITAQGETTKSNGVRVYNTSKSTDIVTFKAPAPNGGKIILPQGQVTFFSIGNRVTCDKLIKHGGAFEIVLAIARPSVQFPRPPEAFDSQGQPNPDFIMTESGDRNFAYGTRINATKICVTGSYESLGNRPRQINNCYAVKEQ